MPALQVIARHTTVDGMRDAVFAILPKLESRAIEQYDVIADSGGDSPS
ncbi:MAG TPA: hypothetical protein VE400_08200 [Mycobacterium sp.]|nr:hypothetical protein [Mycobacterium sp.]